jgi:hypothetical protein
MSEKLPNLVDLELVGIMEMSPPTGEVFAMARKLLGRELIQNHEFTPAGPNFEERFEADNKAWRYGHRLMGTPGFEDAEKP